MTRQNLTELRRIVRSDAAAVHRLRLRALREHPTAFLSDLEEEVSRSLEEVAARIRDDDDHVTMGAFNGPELIGVAVYAREIRRKQRHRGGIYGMHVAAEWQGRGIGGRLLDALVAHGRLQAGLTQLALGVIVGNDAARRLYLSRGFEPYGVDPAAIHYEGRSYDDELMLLDLTRSPAFEPRSRLAGFIVDCQGDDLDAASAFWSAALNMQTQVLPGTEGRTYRRLVDPRHGLDIEVQLVKHPSGVHLDIEAANVDAEARRLEALGATRVRQVKDWWVMQAPTGQRFCIIPIRPA
jgi:RimJ/RimL family protein N-acetyltransferase